MSHVMANNCILVMVYIDLSNGICTGNYMYILVVVHSINGMLKNTLLVSLMIYLSNGKTNDGWIFCCFKTRKLATCRTNPNLDQ